MSYERDTRIFKLKQDGKEYILSLSIVDYFIRISGQENKEKEGNFFESDFSLNDLSKINILPKDHQSNFSLKYLLVMDFKQKYLN